MTQLDIEDLYLRVQKISARHEEKAHEVQNQIRDGKLTPAGGEDRMAAWDNQFGWSQQLKEMQQEVADVLKDSDKSIDKVRASMMSPAGGDTQTQLLAETRLARVWPRIKGDLDGLEGKPMLDAAVAALQSSDASVRPVLAQELQPYLASKKISSSTIDSHVLRHVDPKFAKVLDGATLDKKASVVANYNLGLLQSHMQAGASRDFDKPARWVSPGSLDGSAPSGE